MDQSLTIVMYHYVRDLQRSRFPEIKGLSVDRFKEQIQYIKRHYSPISGYDLLDVLEFKMPLPPRAVLLTFDDGYVDHFTEVFPVLREAGLSGCFFPAARCIVNNEVLDVNKIHFVLASVADRRQLVELIHGYVDEHRPTRELQTREAYWNTCGVPGRYDSADVMFVKRMLQRELPSDLRKRITSALFARFVSADEAAFSRELYMTREQVSDLRRDGMYVGSHGFEHCWLDSIPPSSQANDIDLSLDFLAEVGSDVNRWIMCYPYGAYDDSLLSVLKTRRCRAGLTTAVALANVRDDPLRLPRLDTNDLPTEANAPPNHWTTLAAQQS